MSERIFASSLDGTDELEKAASIKERTVKVRFGHASSGMYHLNNTLVGESLMQVVPASEIVTLGCLRGNHEWHVTLASTAARDVLLEAGEVSTCSLSSTRRGYTEPLVPTHVNVRVLWVPAWVPRDSIYEMLASLGTVVDFEGARERLGDRAVFLLRYTATLAGISPARVPDRVTLEVLGEKVPILLITKGKPRCSFLCGSVSHTQATCPNPVCRYCNRRGHYVSNCPRKAEQQRNSATPTDSSSSREPSRPPSTTQGPPTSTAASPTVTTVRNPDRAAPQTAAPVTAVPPTGVPAPTEGTGEGKRRHEEASDADVQPAKIVREESVPETKPDSPTVIPETQMETPEEDLFPSLEIDLDNT